MHQGYYYLITALPDLSLTDKNPGYDMVSFRAFVLPELTPSDAALLKVLYYPYDIRNLATLIKKTSAPWNMAGNYTRDEMKDMLSLPDTLPEFLQTFRSETVK